MGERISERLTDDEMDAAEERAKKWLSNRIGSIVVTRDQAIGEEVMAYNVLDLIAELRERRAQDLTGEGQAALEWLNDEVRYMIEDGEKDERWRKSAARAIATLSKLLTRGNR